MKSRLLKGAVAGSAGAALAVTGLGVGVTGAQASPSRVYVSPSGTASAPDLSCKTAAFRSIQAAVEAVALKGTVVVCAGVYHQSVTVDRRVDLRGYPGSVIDAANQPYGVGVAVSWVTVSGLTVQHASAAGGAPGDGIVTAGFVAGVPRPADHVTISGNVVRGNQGSGIDINSSSYSVAEHNKASNNGVGINMSDDLGPAASHNRIVGNNSSDNPGGCGIALADHSGAGVFDNMVADNVADRNGLGTPSAPSSSSGSGIILADPTPVGGVHDNVVQRNEFSGNGHAGVALHAHAPGTNFSGNVITQNLIGTNNQRTDSHDLQTTGVYLADASPLTITVIGNVIHDDYYGIFTAGKVNVVGHALNLFLHVDHRMGSYPTYP